MKSWLRPWFQEGKLNIDKNVVQLKVILQNVRTELADFRDVTRNIFTEFWEAINEQNTVGKEIKISLLQHDYGEKDWAKVLVYGSKEVCYFPVRLSLAFIKHCLYAVLSIEIVHAIFKTVPPSVIKTLKAALEDMEEVDEEGLMDVLQNQELKILPNEANLKRIITEMAHKEIIQVATLVIDCWIPTVKYSGLDHASLIAVCKNLVPTSIFGDTLTFCFIIRTMIPWYFAYNKFNSARSLYLPTRMAENHLEIYGQIDMQNTIGWIPVDQTIE